MINVHINSPAITDERCQRIPTMDEVRPHPASRLSVFFRVPGTTSLTNVMCYHIGYVITLSGDHDARRLAVNFLDLFGQGLRPVKEYLQSI